MNSDQFTAKIQELGLANLGTEYCQTLPAASLASTSISLDRVHNRVYFDVSAPCTVGSILSMKLDGSDVRVEAKDAYAPVVNAKGTAMLFTHFTTGDDGQTSTQIRNLSNGTDRELFAGSIYSASWNASGTKIVASASSCEYGDGCSEIVQFDASKHYTSTNDLLPFSLTATKFGPIMTASYLADGNLLVTRDLQTREGEINDVAIINTKGELVCTVSTSKDDEYYYNSTSDKSGDNILFTSSMTTGPDDNSVTSYHLYFNNGEGASKDTCREHHGLCLVIDSQNKGHSAGVAFLA